MEVADIVIADIENVLRKPQDGDHLPAGRQSMSRADLEAFLKGEGLQVDARTDLNGSMRVAYLGSTPEDNNYDAYEITVLQAVGHDTQPLAREVWIELYLSQRWSPQEIRTDNDSPVDASTDRSRRATPHDRAIISVNDTRSLVRP